MMESTPDQNEPTVLIYRIEDNKVPLFVGQQMDVFIDASKSRNTIGMK